MRERLEELFLVLVNSRRTQLCVVLGIVLFFAVLVLGQIMTTRIEFQGVFSPLTEAIRERMMGRYEAAAMGALVSSLGAAVWCFKKDRRRLLGLR